jgi:hypothetical protein
VACSSTNGTNPVCNSGVCELTCNPGYADCNKAVGSTDGCEMNIYLVAGCGTDCGNRVNCSSVNGTNPVCNAGTCELTCNSGYADCNQAVGTTDGCEVDIANDLNNCSGCGKICAPTHVTSTTCNNGMCYDSCIFPYEDKDLNRLNGCENWNFFPKTYGGGEAYSIQQTSDGGYIVAGYTGSFGAGGRDFWVIKLDSSGNITWQKTYGGYNHDEAYSVQQTSDGGYIVAGYTYSFGVGSHDFWVIKLDSSGNIIWQKTYGGTGVDTAQSIQQTLDGGYIVTGTTTSFGAETYKFWVIKLDSNGNVT